MRRTIHIPAVMLAAIFILSACGPATIVANPLPPQRTLNVNGTGMVTLTPDIAYINIGVHTENADAKQAVADNNTQAGAIIAALKGMGIEDKDIRTTNFSINPSQQYDSNGKLTGIIFMVDNTVYITIRDLTKVGDILTAAVEAGANNINGITFDVADKTAAITQGRAQAVKDASQQATSLATAAGVTLGPIQTISYYNSSPVPMTMDVKSFNAAGGAVPVQAGQMTITVEVNVVYEIK